VMHRQVPFIKMALEVQLKTPLRPLGHRASGMG